MKKIFCIASGLLFATQIQAAPPVPCTQANLNGNYVMYQASINHHNHNGRCEINITNGALTGNCVFGHDANNNPGFSGPVYGTAAMNTNCSATATISFDPVPGTVHIDSYFNLQFTPNKESFVGSFSNTFQVEGITNGTRYSPLLSPNPAQ